MKKIDGKTYWKIGQRVLYKLPMGNKICLVKHSSPYNKDSRSHYVTLMVEEGGEEIYSAYDKNLVNLDV